MLLNVIKGTISGGLAGATTPAPNVSHHMDKLGIVNNSTASTLRRELVKEGFNLAKDEGITRLADSVMDKLNN